MNKLTAMQILPTLDPVVTPVVKIITKEGITFSIDFTVLKFEVIDISRSSMLQIRYRSSNVIHTHLDLEDIMSIGELVGLGGAANQIDVQLGPLQISGTANVNTSFTTPLEVQNSGISSTTVDGLLAIDADTNREVTLESWPTLSVNGGISINALPSLTMAAWPDLNIGSMPNMNLASWPALDIATMPNLVVNSSNVVTGWPSLTVNGSHSITGTMGISSFPMLTASGSIGVTAMPTIDAIAAVTIASLPNLLAQVALSSWPNQLNVQLSSGSPIIVNGTRIISSWPDINIASGTLKIKNDIGSFNVADAVTFSNALTVTPAGNVPIQIVNSALAPHYVNMTVNNSKRASVNTVAPGYYSAQFFDFAAYFANWNTATSFKGEIHIHYTTGSEAVCTFDTNAAGRPLWSYDPPSTMAVLTFMKSTKRWMIRVPAEMITCVKYMEFEITP